MPKMPTREFAHVPPLEDKYPSGYEGERWWVVACWPPYRVLWDVAYADREPDAEDPKGDLLAPSTGIEEHGTHVHLFHGKNSEWLGLRYIPVAVHGYGTLVDIRQLAEHCTRKSECNLILPTVVVDVSPELLAELVGGIREFNTEFLTSYLRMRLFPGR